MLNESENCAPHRDLISSSSSSLSGMTKNQIKPRQTKSRRTGATSPRCFKKPPAKLLEKLRASVPITKVV